VPSPRLLLLLPALLGAVPAPERKDATLAATAAPNGAEPPTELPAPLAAVRQQLLSAETEQASWFAKLFPPLPGDTEATRRGKAAAAAQMLMAADVDKASWFAKLFPPLPGEKERRGDALDSKQQSLMAAEADQASWFAKLFPPQPGQKEGPDARLASKDGGNVPSSSHL